MLVNQANRLRLFSGAEAVAIPISVPSGGKQKRAKANVDPDAPKRPPSAYQLYISDYSAPYKTANPTMPQSEIMTHMGKNWSEGISKAGTYMCKVGR